jgi:hypothetical protein
MKKLAAILVAFWLLAGCKPHAGSGSTMVTAPEDAAPLHKDGEGILLCEATKNSIELRTAEVLERKENGQALLVVPKSAVLNTTAGASVYVENGAYYRRATVKTGRVLGELIEITDGLYEGDTVVTHAAQTLWLIELRAVKGGKGCCPMPKAKQGQSG